MLDMLDMLDVHKKNRLKPPRTGFIGMIFGGHVGNHFPPMKNKGVPVSSSLQQIQ